MVASPARNEEPLSEGPKCATRNGRGGDGRLLGASEFATLCNVDLKTIHNWVNRDHIRHFRTPGRHLRFRAVDVAQFLRRFGFAVPRTLESALPRSVVVAGSSKTVAVAAEALGAETPAPRQVEHPYDALILASVEPADVYIFDAEVGAIPAAHLDGMLAALHRASPRSRMIALGGEKTRLPVFVICVERDVAALRTALSVDAEPEALAPRRRR